MGELTLRLAEHFACYNGERPHQSLGRKTPNTMYRTAIGGGAMIMGEVGGAVAETQDQQQPQTSKQRQNWGNAVQLLLKSNVQLKLSGFFLDSGGRFSNA